jgi:hypothetical protein
MVYTNLLPKISAAVTEYEATTKTWKVKATGSGFTGTTDTVKLVVGGIEQVTDSISESEAIFTITNVTSSVLKDVNLYFPIGLPEGNSILNAGLALSMKPESFTPTTGSVGGTLLTMVVPGAIKNTQNLNLVDSESNELCSSVSIPEYGKLLCWTNASEIPAASQLSVKEGSTVIVCTTPESCTFE